MEEPIQEKEKMTTTKDKPPSWKKLKRKLREKSEADGEFQEGEYEEPFEEFEYVYDDD
jgi:hypothetical protein